MRRDELIQALRTSPFRPFRLRVWDGAKFDIRHPEVLMVTHTAVVVSILDKGGNGESSYPKIERSTMVDLLHLTQIEDLRTQSS